MTKPINARNVSISGRRVLFDTNIWLFLNGYSNEARHKANIYSEAHKRLIENGNVIVVNDYLFGRVLQPKLQDRIRVPQKFI